MTVDSGPGSINIHLYYKSDYGKKVEESSPDSWIEVAIVANEIVICGDPQEKSGLTGYACGIQFDLLEVVEAVHSGNMGVVEFEFGPDWVVFEPKGKEMVKVAKSTTYSGIENPETRLEIDPSAIVTKQAVRTEILETVQKFLDNISDINPKIRNHETIIELRKRLEDVKSATGKNNA